MRPNYVSGNIKNHISANFEYKKDAIVNKYYRIFVIFTITKHSNMDTMGIDLSQSLF